MLLDSNRKARFTQQNHQLWARAQRLAQAGKAHEQTACHAGKLHKTDERHSCIELEAAGWGGPMHATLLER